MGGPSDTLLLGLHDDARRLLLVLLGQFRSARRRARSQRTRDDEVRQRRDDQADDPGDVDAGQLAGSRAGVLPAARVGEDHERDLRGEADRVRGESAPGPVADHANHGAERRLTVVWFHDGGCGRLDCLDRLAVRPYRVRVQPIRGLPGERQVIGCGPWGRGGRRIVDRLAHRLTDGGDDAFFQPVLGVVDSVGRSRGVQDSGEVPLRIASDTRVLAILGLRPSEESIDNVELMHAICADQCVIGRLPGSSTIRSRRQTSTALSSSREKCCATQPLQGPAKMAGGHRRSGQARCGPSERRRAAVPGSWSVNVTLNDAAED